MIAVGSTVEWHGRNGVVRSLGFRRATERQIATVAFNSREVLRVPVDELKEVK